MGLFDMLLGRKPAKAARPRQAATGPSTQFDSKHTQAGSNSQSVRKDLLRMVLRETLTRNGIPPTWISADMLRTSSPARRETGLHVRFLVRHWDPRLMQHAVAFEHEFSERLGLLDPLASNWLMGVSWQFSLADKSACPALPHPSTWTAPPPPSSPAPLTAAGEPSSYGDVITGPTALEQPRPLDDVRADLERLLALRDEDLRKHGDAARAYAATRPATLGGG
ncbi:MAG TPA: hypothetical protein VFM98_17360 [Ramlibacter sp.]|uniref:hypothetical protein n=1 Tax=Ramlibacter sp. TaxID=1917967 RepID=UPI002D80BC43|nr:hypothetical protein [Ramlibacter sp.]HET8747371.1 hypothetical protein [Ramlibacter sp.]